MIYLWIALVAIGFTVGSLLAGKSMPPDWIVHLDNAGIIMGYLVTSLTASIAVVGYINKAKIRRWFQRQDFESVGEEFDVKPESVRAMVIPVSRREQPEWILRHLRPEKVSLLFSGQSRVHAASLVKDFAGQVQFYPGLSEMESDFERFQVNDPDNPVLAKEQTERYIKRFLSEDVAASEIFVDTTGGKVPMSIGAFQAAEEEGVSSIYVIGTVKGLIKDPKMREHGRPIFLSDKRG